MMNRFQSLLGEVADQARPPADLADRVLEQVHTGRRRAGLPVMAAAAASVVLVLVGGTLLVPRLLLTTPGWADASSGAPQVSFPANAEPLPDDGSAPAVLAYQPACADQSGVDCDPWRIMTAENEHYELPSGRLGPAPGSEVSVSPSGDRLAYWRPDGKVVLHYLDDGRTIEQVGWDEEGPVPGSRYAWSPDGRWLLAVQRHGGAARLVDTDAGRAYDVGSAPSVALGDLSNGDQPAMFGSVGSAPDNDVSLTADQYLRRYAIPDAEVPGGAGTVRGSVSPDGSRLAVISEPDERASASARPMVSILDLPGERVLESFRVEDRPARWDSPQFFGWRDDSHVLIGTRDVTGRDRGRPVSWQLDSFDIRTGERERVLELPDGAARFDLAYDLL